MQSARPRTGHARRSYAARLTKPLVTVILPTRDRAEWIGRAIDSVLAQSYTRLELLVVDDGSRDATAQVLDRYADRLTVLSQAPAGVYAARNRGMRHANGELVAFMDSDDVWHRHRLVAQLELMRRPEVGLVFGDAAHVRPGVRTASPARTSFATTPPRQGRVAEHFAWGNFVPTITVLARRSCLEEAGGFATSHQLSADYLTWFRIALRHELAYVPQVVADYTVHGDGISHDLGCALQARIELFEEELERTSDPATRALIERLLFVLGLHLALAAACGRAAAVQAPWATARGCLAALPARSRASASAHLVLRQAGIRARRRLGARLSGAFTTCY